MTKTVYNLRDIPRLLKEKENQKATNPIELESRIDGTEMTINNEIKKVRYRDISEIRPHKKTGKIKEFIAMCEWLAGKREFPMEEPSFTHTQILARIRNNHDVPSCYQLTVNRYHELIDGIKHLTDTTIRQMYKRQKNKKEQKIVKEIEPVAGPIEPKIMDKRQIKQEQRKERFRKVIEQIIDKNIIITVKDEIASTIITAKRNGHKTVLSRRYLLEILEDYLDLVKDVQFRAMRRISHSVELKHIRKIDSVVTDTEWYVAKNPKDQNTYILYSFETNEELAILDKEFNIIQSEKYSMPVKSKPKTPVQQKTQKVTEKIQDKQESTIKAPDTLTLIIKLAKQAGASKITIEL